jgi:hypothetical protein
MRATGAPVYAESRLPQAPTPTDLYAQPQAHLECQLAFDGVAELPADVRTLLKGLRSIHDDNTEYIELPEAMECVFHAVIDPKAVRSDTEPKSYRNIMRRPDSVLWHQAMVREMDHLENSMWELVKLPLLV